MIKYILSKLPNSIFNYLDSLVQIERLRRKFPDTNIQLSSYEDSPIYTSSYKDNKIEIRTEKSYISTWSIYDNRGKEIIVEKDDFYYSISEAENAAIEWINQRFTEDINSQDIEEDWGSEYEASLEPKLYGLVVKLKKD